MKKCAKCHSIENLHRNSFSKNPETGYYCRNCTTIRLRQYRQTEAGKKSTSKAAAKAYWKNPQKGRARSLLNYYVKKGQVTKSSHCHSCKQTKPVEGHHIDYNKPLEVTWLCRGCHSDLHHK